MILVACNENTGNKKTESNSIEPEEIKATNAIPSEFKSPLRPNEKIELGKIYTDTVAFTKFNDYGDYFLSIVRKNNDYHSLIYDLISDREFDYLRGDTIEIKWKMDSIWIAGDGERLDFAEWMVDARKIKNGKVHSFRENYQKPLKYWYDDERTNYNKEFLKYLHHIVEYYLTYSEKELVKNHLANPEETELIYSIEETELHDRRYTAIHISNDMGTHSSGIQWIYIDIETQKIYEYDLPNNRLVEFKK